MTTLPRRPVVALVAAAAVMLLAGCDSSASGSTDDAAPGPSTSGDGVPLVKAVAALKVQEESREGYDRDDFEHWVDADGDGCDTRREVLLAEAVEKPEQGERCKLTGGEWESYYDGETVADSSDLDIDHMVPLAEAWDSGASAWSAERREQYANDLGDERALVAVTARTNRSKGDKDPAEWMPPADRAACRYVTEWVVVKTRWALAVDDQERAALDRLAGGCTDEVVDVDVAS